MSSCCVQGHARRRTRLSGATRWIGNEHPGSRWFSWFRVGRRQQSARHLHTEYAGRQKQCQHVKSSHCMHLLFGVVLLPPDRNPVKEDWSAPLQVDTVVAHWRYADDFRHTVRMTTLMQRLPCFFSDILGQSSTHNASSTGLRRNTLANYHEKTLCRLSQRPKMQRLYNFTTVKSEDENYG